MSRNQYKQTTTNQLKPPKLRLCTDIHNREYEFCDATSKYICTIFPLKTCGLFSVICALAQLSYK